MYIAYWRLQILGCLLVVGIVMPLTVLAVGVGVTCSTVAPIVACDAGLTCTGTPSKCVAPPSCPCSCTIQAPSGRTTVSLTVSNVGTATGPQNVEEARTKCQQQCTERATTVSGTGTPTLGTCPASLFGSAPTTPTPATGGETAGGGSGSVTLYNPLGADVGVAEFVGRGIKAVIGIIGAFALLMFIYGGVMWMTAGDSKRVDSAKEILKNSTIGLLLIFFSYSIVTLVFSLLGGTV